MTLTILTEGSRHFQQTLTIRLALLPCQQIQQVVIGQQLCPSLHQSVRDTWQQSRSLTSDLGCPGATCTYGHPCAWTWCSLWTRSTQHRSPITEHTGSDWGGADRSTPLQVSMSLPTWALKSPSRTKEFPVGARSRTPKGPYEGRVLCTALRPIGHHDCERLGHIQKARDLSVSQRRRDTTLLFTGDNTRRLSWGAIGKSTPASHLPHGRLQNSEKSNPLKELGSRVPAVREGESD